MLSPVFLNSSSKIKRQLQNWQVSGHIRIPAVELKIREARQPLIVRNVNMGVNARRKQGAVRCEDGNCQEVHDGVDFFYMVDKLENVSGKKGIPDTPKDLLHAKYHK
jgi:hypothetical protein